jgi:hypothetical protein
MFSDDDSTRIENLSWFFWYLSLEEFLHRHLSDKAESLRVFSFCVRESCYFGDLTDLRLLEVSDRKERLREL